MSEAVWFPSEENSKKTRMYRFMKKLGFSDYDDFYRRSIQDVGWFWQEVVRDLDLQWIKPYSRVMDPSKGVPWTRWFVDGRFNVAQNALDRFVEDPQSRHRLALIWEGDDEAVQKYTYRDLWAAVNRFAWGLQRIGVKPGDRVAIYLPMIAENVIAMMAVARIGAIFTPCFSGYGAEAVATRVRDCEAKVLVTADGFLRRGKVVPMKEEADRAADMSPSVEKVVVVRRLGRDIPWNEKRDVEWSSLTSEWKTVAPGKPRPPTR